MKPMTNPAFIGLFPALVVLTLGCSFGPVDEGFQVCLGEDWVEQVIEEYWANPSLATENHVGQDFCFDGIITSVQVSLEQVGVGVSIANEVGVLLYYDKASAPEQYRLLAEWAEHRREGDIIRVSCNFAEFAPVEGAPEPMVIPVFDDCDLFR